MAPSFANRYLSWYSGRFPAQKHHPLLLPVWIWRVTIPVKQMRKLNLFQRTILGLISSGQKDPEQMAAWLGVDKELILLILANELQANGWVDNKNSITKEGAAILDESLDQRRTLKHCYLFQDAITLRVWPRLSTTLPDIEPDEHENGRVVFSLNRETGKGLHPFVLQPAMRLAPPSPNAADFREAGRRHNIVLQNQELIERERIFNRFEIDEFDLLDEPPEPAFVLTHMRPAEDAMQFCTLQDPLQLSQMDDWIQQLHREIARRHRPFAEKVLRYSGHQEQGCETLEEFELRIAKESEFLIMLDYPKARQVPNLLQYLSGIQRRHEQIKAFLSKSDGFQAPPFGDCDDMVSQCQKAIECCFKFCLRRWPLPHSRLTQSDWRYEQMQEALKLRAGHLFPGTELELFSKAPAKTVFSAIGYSVGKFPEANVSLQPLLVAVLLSLKDHPDHPFMRVPATERQLARFHSLMADRNSSQHASGRFTTAEAALQHSVFTLGWIRSFSNLLD